MSVWYNDECVICLCGTRKNVLGNKWDHVSVWYNDKNVLWSKCDHVSVSYKDECVRV